MMIITPGQIRAARALLQMEQEDLARRTHMSLVAICRLETDGQSPDNGAEIVDAVRHVLEQAGVEFIPEGVRRRHTVSRDSATMFADLRAISLRSAARQRHSNEVDAVSLYDEDGLPA